MLLRLHHKLGAEAIPELAMADRSLQAQSTCTERQWDRGAWLLRLKTETKSIWAFQWLVFRANEIVKLPQAFREQRNQLNRAIMLDAGSPKHFTWADYSSGHAPFSIMEIPEFLSEAALRHGLHWGSINASS